MDNSNLDDKTLRKIQGELVNPLTKKLDRRRFLSLSAVVGASMAVPALVAGCATSNSSTPGASTASTSTSASAPASGSVASQIFQPPMPSPIVMPKSTGKKLRIGNYFQPALTFWQRYQASFLLRLEELGEEPVYVWSEPGFGPSIAAVESVIQQNLDVVVIGGMNKETIMPVMPEIQKLGLKAIGFQNDTPGIPKVGQNSFWVGSLAAMYVIERLGGKGNIAFFNTPGLSVTVDQGAEAIKTVLKFFPDIKIVAEVPAKFPDSAKGGMDDTENLLRRMPGKKDIQAILSTFDEPLIGAARAIKDAGRDKDIFCASCGGDDNIIVPMADGDPVWGSTVWIDYWQMGRMVADMAVAYARGGTVPDIVNVYGALITQSNASAFKKLIEDQNKSTVETLKRYGKK